MIDTFTERFEPVDPDRNLTGQPLADKTMQTYREALDGMLEAFRFELGIDIAEGEIPSREAVGIYLNWLFHEGRPVSAARLALAALRRLAKDEGLPDPTTGKPRDLLKEFARRRRNEPERTAVAIEWEEADKMAEAAAASGTPAGLRDAALIALASTCLLRVSELAAVQVGDLNFPSPGTEGTLTIRYSKTDQAGKGSEVYFNPETGQRLKDWMKAAGIDKVPYSWLFRRIPNRAKASLKNRPLTHTAIQKIIKARAKAAGIQGRVSCHSFRRGSALSLAKRNVSIFLIMEAGRWKSPEIVFRYVRGQAAFEGAVAKYKGKGPPPA